MANWLARLKSNFLPPDAESSIKSMRLGSDEHFYADQDLFEGVTFFATLHLTTPLCVLEHHGEVFNGPPSRAPRYGTQADGIWLPNIKSFQALGIDLPEPPEFTTASDIGPILPSSYIPFLLGFRNIVEGNAAFENKLSALCALACESESYAEIWSRAAISYQDFPTRFITVSA